MRRLLLVSALLVSAAAVPASAYSVQDWCWDNVPGFRTSALVCPKTPDNVEWPLQR